MTKIMSFDDFRQQSKSPSESKLFALIAGIRGAGKSTILGTLGCRTFLIASMMESHAIAAARVFGGDKILSTLYDVDESNKQLKPDKALANLHEILDFLINSPDLLENIDAVAIDSISSIDKTLLETTRIIQEKNGFEQMKLIEQEHLRVIKKLKELHRRGIHVLATMPILASFDEDGYYATATPEIRGITTTSNVAGSFSDVLVVGKPNKDYIFQMDLMIKKVGKEVSGAEKKLVFQPRITGLSREDLLFISQDLVLPADLNYVYQLKLAKQNSKE